jgi:hypothetical protein
MQIYVFIENKENEIRKEETFISQENDGISNYR